MTGTHRFRIDDLACQGHGRCYVIAPKWFDEDELGRGRVRDVSISPEELDKARTMIEECPEDAIMLGTALIPSAPGPGTLETAENGDATSLRRRPA
jgi:ferredoxin